MNSLLKWFMLSCNKHLCHKSLFKKQQSVSINEEIKAEKKTIFNQALLLPFEFILKIIAECKKRTELYVNKNKDLKRKQSASVIDIEQQTW